MKKHPITLDKKSHKNIKISNKIAKKKKESNYALINIAASLFVHIIIFYTLNLIPHNLEQIEWNKKNVQRRSFSSKHSSPKHTVIEVANLVAAAKRKKIDKDLPQKKITLKEEIKSKIDISEKKEEAAFEKLVKEKNADQITEKTPQKKLTFIPTPKIEHGVHSITESSPLASHLIKKPLESIPEPQEDSKKESKPAPLKIASKGTPLKMPSSNKVAKKNTMPALTRVEHKKISLNEAKLLAKDVEKKPSITPELDKAIKTVDKEQHLQQGSPLGSPEQQIANMQGADNPIDVVSKGSDKITKAFEREITQDVTTDWNGEYEKKSNIKTPNLLKPKSQKVKSVFKSNPLKEQIEAHADLKQDIKQLKVVNAPVITKEETSIKMQEKEIEKVSKELPVKYGSPLGTFENPIKDFQGEDPPIYFAPRGQEKKPGSLSEKITIEKDEQKSINPDKTVYKNIVYKKTVAPLIKDNKNQNIVNDKFSKQTVEVNSNLRQDVKQPKIENVRYAASSSAVSVNKKTNQLFSYAPELKNTAKNVQQENQTIEHYSQNEVENDINDIAPSVPFTSDTNEKISKINQPLDQKIINVENNEVEERKTNIKTNNLIKIGNKKGKVSIQNSIVKNEKMPVLKESDIKEEVKRIYKQTKAKTYSASSNNVNTGSGSLTAGKAGNSMIAANITNKLNVKNNITITQEVPGFTSTLEKAVNVNNRKEPEDKKDAKEIYDTSLKIEGLTGISSETNEMIEEMNTSDKFSNLLTKNKKEKIGNEKLVERSIDRNPVYSSKNKRVPLTVVSRGGSVFRTAGQNSPAEEFKKAVNQNRNMKDQNFVFVPDRRNETAENLTASKKETKIEDPHVKENKTIEVPVEKEKIKVEKEEKQANYSSVKALQWTEEKTETEKAVKIEAAKIEQAKLSKSNEAVQFALKEQPALKEVPKKTISALPEKEFKPFKGPDFVGTKTISEKDKFPTILFVSHNATHTLGKGDELEVSLEGDPGKTASFDIGTFRNKLPMNEVSPGVYRGNYRVVEGDNVSNASIIGYLMNSEFNQSSMASSSTINIDTNPGITIASPVNTSVDNDVQTIMGIIDDHTVKRVIVSVDGKMYTAAVQNGYFNIDVELKEGKNKVEVKCEDSKGTIKTDRTEITYIAHKEIIPKVVITYPPDGEVVNLLKSPLIKICGTVSDKTITRAELIGTDVLVAINVEDGEFCQKIVPISEVSSFVVQVVNKEGKVGVSEPITIKSFGLKQYDAIISLNWDPPNGELDMELKSPTGKSISRRSKMNNVPGAKMEMYSKTGLLGQEIMTLNQAAAGLYNIVVTNLGIGAKSIKTSLDITFKDPKNPSKIISKTFGPKTMRVGEEWELSFVCMPEESE